MATPSWASAAPSASESARWIDSYADFPDPEADLAAGRIWSRTAVERWIRGHPSRPGGRRPATSEPAPGSFFDRLDEAAGRSVVLAQEEARLLGHPRIGCEHLLLGLAREQTGIAGEVLASVGANPAALGERLELVAPARTERPQGHLPFTDRAKGALESSYRESLDLDADVIRTEHVLLGLIAGEANLAVQLLHEHLGVPPKQIRQAVNDALSGDIERAARPDRAVPITRPGQRASVSTPDLASALDRLARTTERLDQRLGDIEDRIASLVEKLTTTTGSQ